MAMRGEGRGCPVKMGRREAPCGRFYWMLGCNRNVYIRYSQDLTLRNSLSGGETQCRRPDAAHSWHVKLSPEADKECHTR